MHQVEDPIVLVSADGHAGGPPEVYRDYIEAAYLPALDALVAENDEWIAITASAGGVSKGQPADVLDLIDERGTIRTDGERGAWDMDRRIRELDAEGVAGELLLSGHQGATLPFFGTVNHPYSSELRAAGTRAYHRWISDCVSGSKGRLYGIAEPGPCLDMAATVKELHWVAANGFVGVLLPGMVYDPDLPALHDNYYEPFWAACAETGLVLTMHAGWGGVQGQFQKFLKFRQENMGAEIDQDALRKLLDTRDDSPIRLTLGPRRTMWQLMLSGVFDRHPNLRLALTEVRADWIPATLLHLDRRFEELGAPMKKRPSEYFASNCGVAPSSPHRAEIELRHEIGIDRFMFGIDFPHPEGTWPNTHDWIRDAFAGVPEKEARRILGENTIAFYRLDRTALARVAATIGPKPSDLLLGTSSVDPRKIEHFHKRSGYSRPAEEIDTVAIDTAFADDLAAVGAR
jgi:predicted TIM-barrel fold metal-dependent hydrolase